MIKHNFSDFSNLEAWFDAYYTFYYYKEKKYHHREIDFFLLHLVSSLPYSVGVSLNLAHYKEGIQGLVISMELTYDMT